jgi:hypothetical protein
MKTTYGITSVLMASALSLVVAQAPSTDFDTNAEPRVVQPAQTNLSPG